MIVEASLRAAELTGGTALVSNNPRGHHQLPMAGTLLVHVGDDGTPDALREAVLLAERSHASLFGVAAEGFFIDDEGIDEAISGGGLTSTVDDHRDWLDATEERFRLETRALGGRARLVKEEDHPSVALARHACGADWLIARRPGQVTGSLWVPSIADLVMSAGIPVLLLGASAEPLDGSRVVIGWRDSREVRRAIADAMPFLLRAQEVILADVDDGRETLSYPGLLDVHQRLLNRGCNVNIASEPVSGGSVAATLTHIANTRGADLIVAGGYDRGRLREWVTSGVTSSLIQSCDVHILLSH